MEDIVRDESIRSGDPRIEGTRITVFDIKRRIIDVGEDPHVVAGEYEMSMATIFNALAYYYEHREEFERQEQEHAATMRAGERRTRKEIERELQRSNSSSEFAD